ncbi:hypothetical protein ACYFX5_16745 [Bremerella sp. T1]|uniref:hypothetical protein n=1 Tax=Bremerella sp. TYQ1 TaxID=3119568 RepID=UPI001CCD7D18|nr:hypothetical protein [Bremerella volcania]UBM34707.1 hypothetical protein LA756_18695 [Bremerella volcania]
MAPTARKNILCSLALVAAIWFGFQATNVDGMTRSQYRSHVRSMNILERPNRFGHVYGNNVRRVHHWRHGR